MQSTGLTVFCEVTGIYYRVLVMCLSVHVFFASLCVVIRRGCDTAEHYVSAGNVYLNTSAVRRRTGKSPDCIWQARWSRTAATPNDEKWSLLEWKQKPLGELWIVRLHRSLKTLKLSAAGSRSSISYVNKWNSEKQNICVSLSVYHGCHIRRNAWILTEDHLPC